LATLNLTGEEVFSQWFTDAGMELDAEAVGFEYYLPYNEVGDMLVQLYIPVKPKQSTSAEKHGGIMSVFDVISERRSIRKYKNDPVSRNVTAYSSGRSARPFRSEPPDLEVLCCTGEKRDEMVDVLKKALDNRERKEKM
jgi:phage gp36-like protein